MAAPAKVKNPVPEELHLHLSAAVGLKSGQFDR